MAVLKTFLAVLVILIIKDEAFSCPTRSHKAGSYPYASSLSDSTSNLHHSKAKTISCNTASGSSSSSSSLPSSLTLPSKSTFNSNPLLPAPASFLLPSPHVYSNNYLDILNILTNILSSSPSNVASSVLQIPPATQLTLPNLPLPNIVRGSIKIPKPHTVHPLQETLSGLGSYPPGTSDLLQDLPGLPNGPVPPSVVTPIPSLEFSFPVSVLNASSFNISGDNPEHSNASQKPSSNVSTDLPPPNTPKLIPLSQLCAQFMSTFNKSSVAVQGSTSQNQSHSNPSSDANGSSSGILSGLRPNEPSLNTASKVPGTAPETPVEELLASNAAPTFTPKPATSTPTTELGPVSTLTSHSSTACAGRSPPVVKNPFHKRLLSTSAPKVSNASPPRPQPCAKATLNAASVPGAGVKPHRTSLGCITPLGPSPLPKPAFITPRPISMPTPTLDTAVSSGYNPAFMQLLLNRLISNPNPPLPFPPSSLPYLQHSLNITPVSPPPQNVFQTSTLNRSTCVVNTNPFNVSSDRLPESTLTPGSTTTTTSNTSLCNNPDFTNMLCKLLLPSIATSKTHFSPCLPLSNVYPTSLFNSTTLSSV